MPMWYTGSIDADQTKITISGHAISGVYEDDEQLSSDSFDSDSDGYGFFAKYVVISKLPSSHCLGRFAVVVAVISLEAM